MRNPDRIKPLLEDLEKIWKTHPDMRLCQWLVILSQTYGNWKSNDIFSFEDSDLQNAIQKYKKLKEIK
jgi:uncharacterized protein YihD (DUF1040 family)